MSQQEFTSAVAQSVAEGWELKSQTEDTASLTRRHRFSWGWFILWFILGVLPSVIYIIYWLARPPQQRYIRLSASSKVAITDG